MRPYRFITWSGDCWHVSTVMHMISPSLTNWKPSVADTRQSNAVHEASTRANSPKPRAVSRPRPNWIR